MLYKMKPTGHPETQKGKNPNSAPLPLNSAVTAYFANPHLNIQQGCLLSPESAMWTRLPVSEPQGSACLRFLSTEIFKRTFRFL